MGIRAGMVTASSFEVNKKKDKDEESSEDDEVAEAAEESEESDREEKKAMKKQAKEEKKRAKKEGNATRLYALYLKDPHHFSHYRSQGIESCWRRGWKGRFVHQVLSIRWPSLLTFLLAQELKEAEEQAEKEGRDCDIVYMREHAINHCIISSRIRGRKRTWRWATFPNSAQWNFVLTIIFLAKELEKEEEREGLHPLISVYDRALY